MKFFKNIFYTLFIISVFVYLNYPAGREELTNDKNNTDIKISSQLLIINQNRIKYNLSFKISGAMANKLRTSLLKKSKKEINYYIENLNNNFFKNSAKSYKFSFENLSFNKPAPGNIKLNIKGNIKNLKWIKNNHILIKPPLLSSFFLKKIKNNFSINEKFLIVTENKKLNLKSSPPDKKLQNDLYIFNYKTRRKTPQSYIMENSIKTKKTDGLNKIIKRIANQIISIRKKFLILYYEK